MNQYIYTIPLVVFLSLLGMPGAYAQCPTGDVEILNDYQLQKFTEEYPNCAEITGNLTVSAFKSESTPWLTYDMSFLDNITSVDGNLSISGLDLSNTSVLLPNLAEVSEEIYLSTLKIQGPVSLFPSLHTVHDRFSMNNIEGDNFSIGPKVFEHELAFSSCYSLKTLESLAQCDSILLISLIQCPLLEDISDLDALDAPLEQLYISGCSSLSDCAVDRVCELVTNNSSNILLFLNGPGCSYINEIKEACTESPCPCPIEDTYILSEEQLLQYKETFDGCERIDGNLILGNFTAADSLWNTFQSLKELTGDLVLSRLSNENFSFLSNIEKAFGLKITLCDNLEDLSDFQNLTELNTLELSHNLRLLSINDIQFTDDLGLERFDINNCSQLNFDNIDFSITNLERFHLGHLSLSSINPFSSLQMVDSYTLNLIPALTEIQFTDDFRPNHLYIANCPDLIHISGLNPSITSLTSLHLDTPNLTNFSAFSHIETVTEGLTLANFDQNHSIDFPSLKNVGKLQYYKTSFSSLPTFENLQEVGNFSLEYTSIIQNLEGLEQIPKIETVGLTGNTHLNDISVLTTDLGINDLTLFINHALSECAIDLVCNRSSDFVFNVFGNGPKCQSVEEIDLSCTSPENIAFRNFDFKTQTEVDSFLIEYPLADTIYGNVSISGQNSNNEDVITDLSALSNVIFIDGNLSLHKVSGALLESIKMMDFNNLSISNFEVPLELPDFENVLALEDLIIKDTETIIGDLTFSNLRHCEDINLRNSHFVDSSIRLPSLEEAKNIWVQNSTLQHIFFDSIHTIHNINLDDAHGFEGFRGCKNLDRVSVLSLDGLDAIEAIFDTTSLDYINTIELFRFPNATELKGLENIQSVHRLLIQECESLTRIEFPNLKQTGTDYYYSAKLSIAENAQLTGIHFPELEYANHLILENNPLLQLQEGFPSLRYMGKMSIINCPNIENLDNIAQDALIYNEIEMLSNSNLEACGNPIICNHLLAAKPLMADENHEDCPSKIDLTLSCGIQPNECPEGNVHLRNDEEVEFFETYYNSCKVIEGNLTITGQSITRDISFDSLTTIMGKLKIENYLDPQSIHFESLNFLNDGIEISDNLFINDISTTHLVETKGEIVVRNNFFIDHFNELRLGSEKGVHVSIASNNNLMNLDFLSEIDHFLDLNIVSNYSLETLEDLNPDALLAKITAESNLSLTVCNVPIVCNNLASGYLSMMTFQSNDLSCQTFLVNHSCQELVNTGDPLLGTIKVYPNPVSSSIILEYDGTVEAVKIYDLMGQLKLTVPGSKVIDLGTLPPGNYILSVQTSSGNKSFKISKI